jgi:hypothetical protein
MAGAKKSRKTAAARRTLDDARAAQKPAAKQSAAGQSAAKKPAPAVKSGASKRAAKKPGAGKRVEMVEGGRYVLIDGRRWRATDPSIHAEERARLVGELMRARRDVGRALREGDAEAEREARARVHAAKVALGERGEKWWERDAAKKKQPAKKQTAKKRQSAKK